MNKVMSRYTSIHLILLYVLLYAIGEVTNADVFELTPTLTKDVHQKKPELARISQNKSSNTVCPPISVVFRKSPSLNSKPVDCEELLHLGYNKSGVYNIWPRNKILNERPLEVFCDMETDNGGWTVLQRRGEFLREKDYFFKDWASYKTGFGNIEKDFWLGNDNIYALTNQRPYSVRFDLVDVAGNYRYALYDVFFIDNEQNKYMLTIEDYSGTANDSVIKWHNGHKFSTKDQDNDNHKDSCATKFKGAWWYNDCHASNLNGLYLKGKHDSFADGVIWYAWKGHHESLATTEIKIRPQKFRASPSIV